MLKNMFSGLAKVKVSGLNLDRIFTILKKKNIPLKNIKRTTKKEIFFVIQASHLTKVKESLDVPCYNLSVQKYYGMPFILQFFKKRIGLFIGAILFIVTTLIINSFIWKIEIYGIESLTKEQIVQTLSQAGVSVGQGLNTKNIEGIENYLSQQLEQISMVSIIKKGTSIIVNVKEVRVPSIIANLGQQTHLISGFEGVVTQINVVQGTPLIKVGDVIKTGDALIAGYFDNIDGTKTSCIAMGEVFARVWYSSSINFDTNKTEMIRTGNKVENTSMSLFGTNFNIKSVQNPYENFEIENKQKYLFKNNMLPFKINKTFYYETEPILIEQDFEENKNKLINEAMLLAREKMPINLISNKEFTTIEKNGTIYTVSAYIECQMKVDTPKN